MDFLHISHSIGWQGDLTDQSRAAAVIDLFGEHVSLTTILRNLLFRTISDLIRDIMGQPGVITIEDNQE